MVSPMRARLLIGLLLAGGCTVQVWPAQTQSAPNGRLLVYSTYPGHRHIVCDDTDEGQLSRNRYLEITLSAGRHVCYLKRPAHQKQTWPRYTFEMPPGETVFARESSEMWVGDGLIPVSQETWEAERPRLKPEKTK